MKCEVKLYVAGTVFTEDVVCRNYQEAREVALARNPNTPDSVHFEKLMKWLFLDDNTERYRGFPIPSGFKPKKIIGVLKLMNPNPAASVLARNNGIKIRKWR